MNGFDRQAGKARLGKKVNSLLLLRRMCLTTMNYFVLTGRRKKKETCLIMIETLAGELGEQEGEEDCSMERSLQWS